MGTVTFPCGCSISSSMFEPWPIMYISPCQEHLKTKEVQKAMRNLSARRR
jgi:hypothetical protein